MVTVLPWIEAMAPMTAAMPWALTETGMSLPRIALIAAWAAATSALTVTFGWEETCVRLLIAALAWAVSACTWILA